MILKTFNVIRLTLYIEHQTFEINNTLFNKIMIIIDFDDDDNQFVINEDFFIQH